MQNVKANANNLVSYLQKPPVATLLDREESYDIDEKGNGNATYFQEWAFIKFSDSSNKLVELRKHFEDELTNHTFNSVFKLDKYCKGTIADLKNLKQKFSSFKVGKLTIRIRNDFSIKYLDYIDFVGDPVNGGYSQLFEKILPKDEYNKLQEHVLQKISSHFSFQENLIDELIHSLNNHDKKHRKRQYNADYRYEYFMFDKSTLCTRLSPDECIESFFTALVDNGYIEGVEPVNQLSLYFNNTESDSKVIWTQKGANLYYLIKALIDGKYIKDAKGSITNIIPKIFVKKDGKDFTADELHSRKPSKKVTSDLDRILRFLKQ